MSRRTYHDGDVERIEGALDDLKSALHALKVAQARKTAARVRLAISSCKGALRNIDQLKAKAARKDYDTIQQGGLA